jgi:hypothetical protein
MPNIEAYVPLQFAPGVFKQGTKYQAKGHWFHANLVRWYEGTMGPIGGWAKNKSVAGAALSISGKARGMLGWKDDANQAWMAIGTSPGKLYEYLNQTVTDITPVDLVTGNADGAFSNNGGWGDGFWADVTDPDEWGFSLGAATLLPADTWQIDNYGAFPVASFTADGRIFVQKLDGAAATAIPGAPIGCRGVLVTPERFLVAIGGTGAFGEAASVRRVRWATQESGLVNAADWTPSTTTSAGQFDLTTKGELMAGRRTRRQSVLWTSVDVYAMTFVGGGAVYAFEQLGDNCGAISPNSMVSIGDVVFWMSNAKKFFVYDGALQALNCDVLDYVFQNLDSTQAAKVYAVTNTLFNEILWFYPTSDNKDALGNPTQENTAYVAYNYKDKTWAIGNLGRASGIDRGIFGQPQYVSADPTDPANPTTTYLYQHEFGFDHTGAGVPFAESGPGELKDISGEPLGFDIMRVQKYIPDEKTFGAVSALNDGNQLGSLQMTFYRSRFPDEVEKTVGPIQAANPTNLRFSTRNIRVRVDEIVQGLWRFGVPRLGVLPAGRR